MASERDELNRRRRARMEQERRRKAARRKLKIRLVIAAVVILACAAVIYNLGRNGEIPLIEAAPTEVEIYGQADETTEETTVPKSNLNREPTVIHLAAAGDLNVTDKVVWSGQSGAVYDYTSAFMDVAPIFSEADMALLNFEGNIYGQPYGTATMSAPQELMVALKNAGVDVVQMANTTAIYNGISGLQTTLANIRAAGIEPVGAYSTNNEFAKNNGYTICEVQGLKIAMVAFTKGFGGLGLPAGSEDCVNVLYEDYATTYQKVAVNKINSILKNVRAAEPDYIIALLHWGSEYNDEYSGSQEEIREVLFAGGVDAIVGTHPHRVQAVDFDFNAGQFTAYSLGDFFSDTTEAGTNYSIVLNLEITRNNQTGETKLTDYTCTPIYNMTPEESGEPTLRLVRTKTAMEGFERGIFNSVSEELYNSMAYTLDRIEYRLEPPAQEEE